MDTLDSLAEKIKIVNDRIQKRSFEDNPKALYFKLGKLMYEASKQPDCPPQIDGGLKKWVTRYTNVSYVVALKCKTAYELGYIKDPAATQLRFGYNTDYKFLIAPTIVKAKLEAILSKGGTITVLLIDSLVVQYRAELHTKTGSSKISKAKYRNKAVKPKVVKPASYETWHRQLSCMTTKRKLEK